MKYETIDISELLSGKVMDLYYTWKKLVSLSPKKILVPGCIVCEKNFQFPWITVSSNVFNTFKDFLLKVGLKHVVCGC